MRGSGTVAPLIRFAAILFAAAVATMTLFLIMLAFIATSFERPKEKDSASEFIILDAELNIPVIKAKISKANTSLLNPIELPPSVNSKTTSRQNKPQHSPVISVNQGAVSTLAVKPKITVNMPRLSLSGSGGSAQSRAAASGNKQCTLVAHIGPGTRDIANVEFMNCLHGEMADAAESALYNWINGGADSYLALGAQPGDAVEFTYEKKS